MKILKILMVSLFLVTTIQSNATSVLHKDDLIKRMSNDDQVLALIKNSAKILFVNAFNADLSALPTETLALYDDMLSKSTEIGKNVSANFPLFAAMTKSEKSEILRIISTESTMVASTLSCVFDKITVMLGCVGISSIGWGAAKFWLCAGVAGLADMAAEIASLGAASPAVIAAAVAEIMACAAVNGATLTLITGCSATLTVEVLKC